MRGTSTYARAVVLLVAALALLAGCGGSESSGDDRELVVLQDDIAPGLDVDGANAAHDPVHQVVENVMEALIEYPSELEGGILQPDYLVAADGFEPRLAESWEHPAPTKWIFKLRQGVKSCAGNELTADDVVWTFARAKSVSGGSPIAWFLANVGGVLPLDALISKDPAAKKLKGTEVRKVDKYTVEINQFTPTEMFPKVLEIFALHIFDSTVMKENATATDPWAHKFSETQDTPGFGPYCLNRWTKGSEIVLEANPNYYRGQPHFTRVVLRRVPQAANRVAAIRSGDADIVTNLSPRDIANVREDEDVEVLSWFNNEIVALGFNFKVAPWNLPKGKLLRQAIAYALPYDEILEQDYLGNAKRWFGVVESRYYGYKELRTYEQRDVERAKQLLAEAGFADGNGLAQHAQGLQLNYVVERRELLEPVANRIKTALAEIGVPITLNPVTDQEYNQRELVKRDMPMFLRERVRPFGPDVAYAGLLFYVSADKGGLINAGNYSNPQVDAAIFASQAATGDERLKHLHRAQELVLDDVAVAPILETPTEIAVRKGISCWHAGSSHTIHFWTMTTEGGPECSTEPR